MGKRRRWRLKGRHGLLVLLLLLLCWFIAWLFGRVPGSGGGGERGRKANAAGRGGGRGKDAATPVLRDGVPGEALGNASGKGPDRERRPLRGPAHLTGQVTDADGRPLPFAEVLVMRGLDGTAFPGLAPDPALARVRADENGRFFATVIPPAEGVVLLLADDAPKPWVRSAHVAPMPWGAPVVVNLRRLAPSRTPLALSAHWAPGWTSAPPNEIHVLARPAAGATLLGPAPWCVDEKGRPPRTPEALPHLVLDPGRPTPLTFLGDGAWDLLVWAPGARAVALTVERGASSVPAVELAPLSQPSTHADASGAWWYLPSPNGLTATLWPAAAFEPDVAERGRLVILEAGGGARPLEAPSPTWAEYSVAAESQGEGRDWEFRLVPVDVSVIEGQRFDFVTASLWGEWPDEGRVRAGSFRVEWIDRLTGLTVTDSGGIVEATQGRPLTLHPPARTPTMGRVSGRVVDAVDGRPVEGARILAGAALEDLPCVRLAPWARTDRDGRFEIRGAPAGSLDLWVTAPRYAPGRLTVAGDEDSSADAAATIPLQRGPACTVTLAEGGAPDLRAVLVDRQGATVEAPFDTEGKAHFPQVAPGPHVLLLAIGPFQVPTEDWLRLSRIPGARSVEIRPDSDTKVGWETAPWSTGKLRIHLVGQAPEKITLEVSPERVETLGGVSARLRREKVVDGDEVTLVRWPPGRYLGVAHAGLASSLVAFTLKPGGTTAVTLEFRFE